MDVGLSAQRHVPTFFSSRHPDGCGTQCRPDLARWLRPDALVNRRQGVFADYRRDFSRSHGRERLGPVSGDERTGTVRATGQSPFLRSGEAVGRRALLSPTVQRCRREFEHGSHTDIGTRGVTTTGEDHEKRISQDNICCFTARYDPRAVASTTAEEAAARDEAHGRADQRVGCSHARGTKTHTKELAQWSEGRGLPKLGYGQ